MSGNKHKITIDGPAGSGKSSLAKLLAKKLKLVHLDTGALYRTIALYFVEQKFNLENISNEDIENQIKNIKIKYFENQILLNDKDVFNKIRTDQISQAASILAKNELIRNCCNNIQQEIIKKTPNLIMDGRDCGTIIMPNANFKFFLKTSAKTRAIRRLKDQNKDLSEENIKNLTEEIKIRDNRDMSRTIAPLKPAHDAIIIDNSSEKLEETFQRMLDLILK